ncbi:MAG: hypothetical protein HY329_19195, partial [Chloroflexi bacterium]|nr:hypothetical protein [Chloroflexota bacterium]
GEAPHNVNDHVSTVGENILFTCANMMSNVGSNPLWYMPKSQWFVAFGPEHARTVANDGWSKLDIKRYFFEEARCRLGDLKRGGMYGAHEWPIWVQTKRHDDDWIPVANSPEDFLLMVVGGPGKHSSVIPNSTMGHAVTRPIDRLLPAT